MAIESVRLFAHRLLREPEPDHVRNDDAPACPRQRPHEVAVQKPPCRVAVQENHRVAGALVNVVHAPAVDALKSRLEWPFLVRKARRRSLRLTWFGVHGVSPHTARLVL